MQNSDDDDSNELTTRQVLAIAAAVLGAWVALLLAAIQLVDF